MTPVFFVNYRDGGIYLDVAAVAVNHLIHPPLPRNGTSGDPWAGLSQSSFILLLLFCLSQ